MAAPIVLVPGFWLGAWAWDDVVGALSAEGVEATAITLPGLESQDADRSSVTLSDHVEAICDAVRAAGSAVVLAVHSGTGFSGYAATDRIPELIANMVYVDSAPGKGALEPGIEGDKEFNWEELAEEENLDGLSEEQLETFRQRAVAEPGGVVSEHIELTNDARRDVPTTMLCTGFPSEQIRQAAAEHDWAWLAGVPELRNVTWLDLPTSHWPMWSRPQDLATILADIARASGD